MLKLWNAYPNITCTDISICRCNKSSHRIQILAHESHTTVHRIIIVSNNYWLQLPVSLFISFMRSTQPTNHMHSRAAAGSDKWYWQLWDKIRTLYFTPDLQQAPAALQQEHLLVSTHHPALTPKHKSCHYTFNLNTVS